MEKHVTKLKCQHGVFLGCRHFNVRNVHILAVSCNAINRHHRVFCAPAEGVHIGNGAENKKKLEWLGYRLNKKFDDIFSHVDTVHQRDRGTYVQTDTRRQQRPRLRIASRGKNYPLHPALRETKCCVAYQQAGDTFADYTWMWAWHKPYAAAGLCCRVEWMTI